MAKVKKSKCEIFSFFHCKKCLKEYELTRVDQTAAEFQKISVGWTKKGFQVWCERHQKNIANFDFLGQKISFIES